MSGSEHSRKFTNCRQTENTGTNITTLYRQGQKTESFFFFFVFRNLIKKPFFHFSFVKALLLYLMADSIRGNASREQCQHVMPHLMSRSSPMSRSGNSRPSFIFSTNDKPPASLCDSYSQCRTDGRHDDGPQWCGTSRGQSTVYSRLSHLTHDWWGCYIVFWKLCHFSLPSKINLKNKWKIFFA